MTFWVTSSTDNCAIVFEVDLHSVFPTSYSAAEKAKDTVCPQGNSHS